MKVVLFGATGMIGQGVLRECLLSTDVESVLAIGRSTTGKSHEKLRELTHSDLTDYGPIEGDLAGLDAIAVKMLDRGLDGSGDRPLDESVLLELGDDHRDVVLAHRVVVQGLAVHVDNELIADLAY